MHYCSELRFRAAQTVWPRRSSPCGPDVQWTVDSTSFAIAVGALGSFVASVSPFYVTVTYLPPSGAVAPIPR